MDAHAALEGLDAPMEWIRLALLRAQIHMAEEAWEDALNALPAQEDLIRLDEALVWIKDYTLRARIATAQGDVARAEVWLSRARAIASADPWPGARPLLDAAVDRSLKPAPWVRVEDTSGIVFDPQGYGFTCADGTVVDLSRRRALRAILLGLIEARQHGHNVLTVLDLIEIGWPGEKIHPQSAMDRVYTAIRSLRRMGLEEILVTRDGGYALDGGRVKRPDEP